MLLNWAETQASTKSFHLFSCPCSAKNPFASSSVKSPIQMSFCLAFPPASNASATAAEEADTITLDKRIDISHPSRLLFCVWTIWTYDLSWGAWTAAPCWSEAKTFAVVEISSIPCQLLQTKKHDWQNAPHHRQKTKPKKTLCPTVVLRGMSRRRMGYLVRLSGKSLSFSRTRHMTSTNIPWSSTLSRSHIIFFQSALSMVNRTTPRTPRKASSTAHDFPDWKRPPMMVALYRQLLMRFLMVSITGVFWWPHLPSLWVQKAS